VQNLLCAGVVVLTPASIHSIAANVVFVVRLSDENVLAGYVSGRCDGQRQSLATVLKTWSHSSVDTPKPWLCDLK
jgi:hypothetical protein